MAMGKTGLVDQLNLYRLVPIQRTLFHAIETTARNRSIAWIIPLGALWKEHGSSRNPGWRMHRCWVVCVVARTALGAGRTAEFHYCCTVLATRGDTNTTGIHNTISTDCAGRISHVAIGPWLAARSVV